MNRHSETPQGRLRHRRRRRRLHRSDHVDPRLNANPRVDEAHHRVSAQGFKYYVTEQVCWAAGGPQTYSGRSMLDSHRELLITAEEWDAFMDDFHQTLAKFSVPERERGELDAIIESTKDDIVTSAAPAV